MQPHTNFGRLFPILLCIVAVGGLLLGAQAASAATPPNCIQDVWKAHNNNQNLTCTANDVTLSSATNIQISLGGSCDPVTGVCKCQSPGNVTFSADFEMDLTADTRYDIGFYIATDGDPNHDGALTGQCSATASLAGNTQQNTFINLDVPPNCSGNACQTGDVCGDITGPLGTAHNPVFVRQTITTPCVAGPSGKLELPFCTTWRQPGSNQVCLGTGTPGLPATNDVFPGSPSKCNCGTLAVDILTEAPTISVTKAANPTQINEGTPTDIIYTVDVKNDGSFVGVTVQKICDDQFGTVKTSGGLTCPAGALGTVKSTTCIVPQDIAAGATYECTFTASSGSRDVGQDITDQVCATGHDANTPPNPLSACNTATVTVANVNPTASLSKTVLATVCATMRYEVRVLNTDTVEPLTLTALSDDTYGSITTVHGNVTGTTCGVATGDPGLGSLSGQTGGGAFPFTLQTGDGNFGGTDTYTCKFDGTTCTFPLTDTVTGTLHDDENNLASPTGSATVRVNNSISPPGANDITITIAPSP